LRRFILKSMDKRFSNIEKKQRSKDFLFSGSKIEKQVSLCICFGKVKVRKLTSAFWLITKSKD